VEGGRTRVDWLTPVPLTSPPTPGAASGQICRIQACFSRQRWSGRTQHVYLHPRPRATAPHLPPPTAPAPLPPPSPWGGARTEPGSVEARRRVAFVVLAEHREAGEEEAAHLAGRLLASAARVQGRKPPAQTSSAGGRERARCGWSPLARARWLAGASGRRSVYLPCSMLSAAAVGPGID
jgi:hypothetical protein